MKEQLSAKYSRETPLRVSKKQEFLIWLGLIGSPFLCFLPMIGRYSRGLSLVPIWLFAVPGITWQLIFYFGHEVTPFKKFREMSDAEKRVCLLYDSFWYNLVRSGFGLYAFIALVWSLIEYSLGEGQVDILAIFFLFGTVFILFCFIRREWIIVVAIEGLEQHKKLRNAVAVIMGFFVIFPIFGGVARMIQVTMGQPGLDAIIPFIILSMTILALAVFALTLLGSMIAYAQYSQWKKRQNELKIHG